MREPTVDRRAVLKATGGAVLASTLLAASSSADDGAVAAPDPSTYGTILAEMDGDGSAADPYVITDVVELQAMAGDLDAAYELGANIDASATAAWNPETEFESQPNLGRSNGHDPGDQLRLAYTPIDEIIEARERVNDSPIAVSIVDADEGLIELEEATDSNPVIEYRTTEAIPVGFTPVGDGNEAFTGSFDGRNYELSGLFVDRRAEEGVGLFGHAADAHVERLSLVDATVRGDSSVGGLVGAAPDPGSDPGPSVDGVAVEGTVTGRAEVGGLVGDLRNGGTVVDSSAAGEVVADSPEHVVHVGGLVGRMRTFFTYEGADPTVESSHASADVLADPDTGHSVGGLVGELSAGTVADSSAEGEVVGDQRVGGLIGGSEAATTVSDCSASGAVSGFRRVGGLVGVNEDDAVIRDCAASGAVDAESVAGGFVGTNRSTIERGSAAGRVEALDLIGGLVGRLSDGGQLADSHATGDVVADGGTAGGIVGQVQDHGEVRRAYATGAVTGGIAGGVVGVNSPEWFPGGGSISRAYAHGAVTGETYAGGIAGVNSQDGLITAVYAIGTVSGDGTTGGLVGMLGDTVGPDQEAIVRDAYWDTETTDQADAVGVIAPDSGTAELRGEVLGRETAELQGAGAADQLAAFDFETYWLVVTDPDDYPTLREYVEPSVEQYVDESGTVQTEGLRHAIDDWHDETTDTELLREVIDAWRSGASVS